MNFNHFDKSHTTIEHIIAAAGPWHAMIMTEYEKACNTEAYNEPLVEEILQHFENYYAKPIYKYYSQLWSELE